MPLKWMDKKNTILKAFTHPMRTLFELYFPLSKTLQSFARQIV